MTAKGEWKGWPRQVARMVGAFSREAECALRVLATPSEVWLPFGWVDEGELKTRICWMLNIEGGAIDVALDWLRTSLVVERSARDGAVAWRIPGRARSILFKAIQEMDADDEGCI